MSNILNSLNNVFNSNLLGTAANFLGESNSNVEKAARGINSSILGSLLEKGDDSGIASVLTSAATQNEGLLSSIGDIFSGNIAESSKQVGAGFLSSLFGDKLGDFSEVISENSGISTKSSSALMGMMSPVIAGFLGNKMKSDGLDLSGLLGSIGSQKEGFLSFIPEGLVKLLGLGSITALGSKFLGGAANVVSGTVDAVGNVVGGAANVAGDVVSGTVDAVGNVVGGAANVAGNIVSGTVDAVGNAVGNVVGGAANVAEGAVKKTGSFIKWLLPLVLLALLALFLFNYLKGCNNAGGSASTSDSTTMSQSTTSIDSNSNTQSSVKESVKVILPSGLELNAFKGGIEEQVVEFLKSGDIKNLTEEQLKEKWFSFDNINYVSGSADKLAAESETQVTNLVAILKEFKDAKIKLGAYTDRVGDDNNNLKLSQGRADNMKKRLTDAGVGTQVIGAEGYGEKFATVDEKESNEARAVDRKIALRFSK